MPAVIGRLKNGAHGQLPLALGDDLTGRADEKPMKKVWGARVRLSVRAFRHRCNSMSALRP
jgi:hypothetical protein